MGTDLKDHRIRVVTTIPGTHGMFWGDNTTLISEKCKPKMYGPKKGKLYLHFLSCSVAVKLLLKRKKFDVAVVEGGPMGAWFSWLQSLFFFDKIPTLMIDCLWYRQSNSFIRMIKGFLMRLSNKSVSTYTVWARHEVNDYSREFGIAKEKFVYVPFHTTIENYVFETRDDGFIFAGGNGDRDYKTLIEAVRGLAIPVLIAATDTRLFKGLTIPSNISIKGLTHQEFRKKMAACRVAVVPMQGGLLHSGGQQTFLNSMAMGKPTIIVGPRAAEGYIEHGKSGLIIKYGDVAGLREAIVALYNDSDYRQKMGVAGQSFASRLTTERFVRTIFAIAESLIQTRGETKSLQ